jgi:hypothetical protein
LFEKCVSKKQILSTLISIWLLISSYSFAFESILRWARPPPT